MKILLSLLTLISALFITPAISFAATGGGGGMDSGGGSGLHFRLQKAKVLAMEVFSLVDPKHLPDPDSRLVKFYEAHRNELLVETITSPIVLKPASEVFILQGNEKVFKSMTTQLIKGSTVHVNDSLETQDLPELIANLIHEYGHHFGVPQEDDAFLDTLATTLVQKAIELSEDFRRRVKPCLTGEEVLAMMAGTWVGKVTFIPSIEPWGAKLTILPDGSYIDESDCQNGQRCPSVFYYGFDGPHPAKKIRMNNSCGALSGRLNVVWEVGTVRAFELRSVNLSVDKQELEIEAYHFNPTVFPLILNLRRRN